MSHPTELMLRRVFTQESGTDDAKAHLAACEACRAKYEAIAAEQKAFEQAIPFERFAAGVERARRTPREVKPPQRAAVRVVLALAASVVLVVAVQSLLPTQPTTRLKGGAGVEMVVAGPDNGPQRAASTDPLTPEALSPGERVRLGLNPGVWRYAVVVSVDESGEVAAVYPAQGESLAVLPSAQTEYLPDSLEFTGQGLERVIVVMSDRPLPVSEVVRETRIRFGEARGQLLKMGTLDVAGEQFHRTFLKP